MRNIFWGLILVFIDFNITMECGSIGLLPDFIGYALIASGLSCMAEEGIRFVKARPFAMFMIFYTGIIYVLDFAGMLGNMGAAGVVIEAVALAVSFYIEYEIVKGVMDMEDRYRKRFGGQRLFAIWKVAVVAAVASYVCLLIPEVALSMIIASLIVNILFLVQFNTAKSLYEAEGC